MITQPQIRRGLGTEQFGLKVYTFETIDSTNNCAKALANVGSPEGVLVYAEEQTAGRGRFNRTWESEKDRNLTFSLILRPAWTKDVHLLTYLLAVSTAKAVEETTGLPVISKWPNDLLCNGKKFCGILLEVAFAAEEVDFVVAGVGINVNQESFPAEYAGKAISLRMVAGGEIDRLRLLQEWIRQTEKYYLDARTKGFRKVMREWTGRCMMFGKKISVDSNGSIITGIAEKLDTGGALVINTGETSVRVLAGDVTVLE